MEDLKLSSLPKTWIFDLDGTILVHNGYKKGGDRILPGVKEFFDKIPETDHILILTARKEEVLESTIGFLKDNGIRYNNILADIPFGERILLNDMKDSGLKTAYAINLKRDEGLNFSVYIDEDL
ncbi:MAG: hypothetical protein KIC55_09965 [Lachnoanaerobaculum sp.]|uniref:hypothetical protein n=1 Tax=Lachnoanaerobaculum sp. TaxID=2049030 RepID=UPI0025BA5053|nr:hypothetical protein [Lachnoanaerobaculum sp.]MBS5882692.1 hypothetical protein [Lachnoanaerobaculum sp.]